MSEVRFKWPKVVLVLSLIGLGLLGGYLIYCFKLFFMTFGIIRPKDSDKSVRDYRREAVSVLGITLALFSSTALIYIFVSPYDPRLNPDQKWPLTIQQQIGFGIGLTLLGCIGAVLIWLTSRPAKEPRCEQGSPQVNDETNAIS